MQEAEVFKQLVMSDTAKALVHVFFAQRATSKVRLDKPFNSPKAVVFLLCLYLLVILVSTFNLHH